MVSVGPGNPTSSPVRVCYLAPQSAGSLNVGTGFLDLLISVFHQALACAALLGRDA